MADTGKLFSAVKLNDHELIKILAAKKDANINAKNTNQATILHIAAWKGYLESVKVILASKGDPNIVGAGGSTPLHYAAKFGHVDIVKELLAHGAIHDLKIEKGKTPLDLCNDPAIKRLLKTIDILFESVKMERTKLIDDLNKIKDMSIAKAVVNARNGKKQTLIEAAIIAGCIGVKETFKLFADDEFKKMSDEIQLLTTHAKFDQVNEVVMKCFNNRVKIFGPESPASLLFEKLIHGTAMQLGNYQEAYDTLNRIYELEKRTLGENCHVTLVTNSGRGESLLRLGRYQEAQLVLETVCEKFLQLKAVDCYEFLNAHRSLGHVYVELGYPDKAMQVFKSALKMSEEMFGTDHKQTFDCQVHIATLYSTTGAPAEAREMFLPIYNHQKSEFGIGHMSTLQTLYNIIQTYILEDNTVDAEPLCKALLEQQLKHLGKDHIDTLRTQICMGKILMCNDKNTEGQELLSSFIPQLAEYLGPDHPEILDATFIMKGSIHKTN